MKRTVVCGLALGFLLVASMQGQEVSILMRTPVELELAHHINSKYSPVGSRVWLRVVEDVVENGHVVIAKDSWAEGVVSDAKRSKSLGRAGSMAFELRVVHAVDGTVVPLEGTAAASGRRRTGATVGMVIGFGLPGLFSKGRMAYAMKGTPYTAYVAVDRTVKLADSTSEPPADTNEVVSGTASVKPPKYELKIEKGKKSKPIEVTVSLPNGASARDMYLVAVDDMDLPMPISPEVRGNTLIFDGWSVVQFCNGGRAKLLLRGKAGEGSQVEATGTFELIIKRKS